MKIGLVSLHTSPGATPGQGDAGGLNVVVAEAAAALSNLGHDVTVLTRATRNVPAGSRPLHPPRLRNAIAGNPPDQKGATSPRLVAVAVGKPNLQKLDLVDVLDEFSDALESLGPFDVLHSHYWLSGIAAGNAARRLQIPHVTTLHTVAAQKNAHLSPAETPEPQVRLEGERDLTRSANVVASSRSELDGITTGYGEPPLGARVIAPGVNTAFFRPQEKTTDRLQVTVLGRVQPLKGQDLAVQAISELARQDPGLANRVELVVAGEPTAGAEHFAAGLRAFAYRAAPATVRFLPALPRDEAADLLAASHVVLIPSHSETFGLVALEAAASGTPVIAAHTTGLTESVAEGVSGVFVYSRDAGEWADTIRALLTDHRQRARLGGSARAYALEHDWTAHARQLEQLYTQLVANE